MSNTMNRTFKAFEIPLNSKVPVLSWSDSKNHKKHKNIDLSKNNYGILCGSQYDLIVVDVDLKDEGFEEFNQYITEYGEPKTYKVRSRSGGFHYYFTYKHDDLDTFRIIDTVLTNSSGYRGKGIDIRTNGGYIIGAGSRVKSDDYESSLYEVVNNVPISQMPSDLARWLTNNGSTIRPKKSKKTKKDTKISDEVVRVNDYPDMVYDVTDDQIREMLNKLEPKYYENYSHWLIITTILKTMNKRELWVEFSKKYKFFDAVNNDIEYNKHKGIIDINHLAYLTKSPLIKTYKPYHQITKNLECKSVEFNKQYLKFEKELFNNKTVIVESCTGTGKTTHIASQITDEMNDNKDLRLVSIVCLTSLVAQHIKSFDKIDLKSYKLKSTNFDQDDLIICINSLDKMYNLHDDNLKNMIVYIDEINSFLECLTHNDTLDRNLKRVFRILTRMIKLSHKVIVSDALISDNVFNFLGLRDNISKIFIKNTYLKYQGIKAYEMADENDFYKKVKGLTKKGKPYFFGADSCTIATNYHDRLKEDAKNKDNMILITSETGIKINDASEELKDKQTFASPSITSGIDVSFDQKQNVFIYINGLTLQPSGSFQQTTRIRNIDNLYYHTNESSNQPRYNSIEDVEKYYKSSIDKSNTLYSMCTYIDQDEELVVVDNLFFKLFCYNEYVKDVYHTNKSLHYRSILLKNGFDISKVGDHTKLDKTIKNEMVEARKENNDQKFDRFLELCKKGGKEYDNLIKIVENLEDHQNTSEFVNYMKNVIYFNLLPDPNSTLDDDDLETINKNAHFTDSDLDRLEKYKEYIISDYSKDSHKAVIDLLKSDDYITRRSKDSLNKTYDVHNISSRYAKIKILRDFEKILGISKNDISSIDIAKYDNPVVVSDTLYGFYKVQFPRREKSSPPTTYYELAKTYISTYKAIIGDIPLISTSLVGNKKRSSYKLDVDVLMFHVDFNELRDPLRIDFDSDMINFLNIDQTTKQIDVTKLKKSLFK